MSLQQGYVEQIEELRSEVDRLHAELARREDPAMDLVHANIEMTRNMLWKGLVRAKRLMLAGKDGLAVETIDAALSFHPMYAEDWPGWPEDIKKNDGRGL